MKEFWNTIQLIFSAVGGWLGYFLGGCDGLLYALVAFVVIDYITGVMCAIINRELSSAVGFKGIFRKVREGRHAKIGLFAGALTVEYPHQAFFLFGEPVAARLKALFLGLDGGCLGADIQDEFCKIFEDRILFHLKQLNLREHFIRIAEDFPGLLVKLDGIRQAQDFCVDLIQFHGLPPFRFP